MIPRILALNGRPASKQQKGHGASGHEFQSKAYRAWEKAAKAQLRQQWHSEILTTELRVDILVVRKIPKSTPKARVVLMDGKACTAGLDWDNAAKSVCDPFNGIVWADDRQIVQGSCRKRWGADDIVAVRIREVSQS